MNHFSKSSLWLLLLSGVFCIEASDATFFLRTKAAITGMYNRYAQWQHQKRQIQEKKEQEEKEHQELLKQLEEKQEHLRQQEEQEQDEKRRQREERAERVKQEDYKGYFDRQTLLYQGLVNLGILGARPLSIDVALAEQVLTHCPTKVSDMVIDFEDRALFKNKKNLLFHGPSGTGKSVLAQAIAIKCMVPCLFFNVGTLSTEYMNSGVQNLNKIAECAQGVAKQFGQPCIVILDELESLTKKHAESSNHENNILITFWQELDKLGDSQVIVIGTMNSIKDVPRQIKDRTFLIEIPLPTQQQREAVISYHLKNMQNKYNLEYPQWLTATYLAARTKEFSNRALENVVTEAIRPARRLKRMVEYNDVLNPINEMKAEYKKERKNFLEQYLEDHKNAIPVASLVIAAAGVGVSIVGVYQNRIIADRQMSAEQIAKTAAIGGGLFSGLVWAFKRYQTGKPIWSELIGADKKSRDRDSDTKVSDKNLSNFHKCFKS